MPIPTATAKYYKTVTSETSVNPKTRFEANNIKWTEDITYAGTYIRVFYLETPLSLERKPAGCKKMHWIKYFNSKDGDIVPYTEAGVFYSTTYPRYEHVAQYLTSSERTLTNWSVLNEDKKQYFCQLWGKEILESIFKETRMPSTVHADTDTVLKSRPNHLPSSISEEYLEEYTVPVARRTLTINTSLEQLDTLKRQLIYYTPDTYIIDE